MNMMVSKNDRLERIESEEKEKVRTVFMLF